MYPAMKEINAVPSGTGVFYQAMPAVGADGKNIMKLIPVQMVNGQFLQSGMKKPQTDATAPKAVTMNIASAPVQVVKNTVFLKNPPVAEQVVRKHVTLVTSLPNPVGLDRHSSLNKHPLLAKVLPQMAAPATNCPKLAKIPSRLPVTVKSPVLPRGQYLQIPPNAQVRTVPASELPPSIKKQIFTSPANLSPSSGLPSVVYVSPVTTVKQSVTPPSDSAFRSPNLLSNNSLCGSPSTAAKKHLKLIKKVSQRPDSPLKWTIEEEDNSMSPTIDPLNYHSITSEILLTVAERENVKRPRDITTPVSELNRDKTGQGQEDALVMCNGKVFFVAKKCSLPLKTGKNDSPTPVTKSPESNKIIAPLSQQAIEPIAPKMQQDAISMISNKLDEVIDLCDDDDGQDGCSQKTASVNMSAVTQLDEDNVIFVSYIPPKTGHITPKTQMAHGKESNPTVTRQQRLDATTGTGGSCVRVCHSAMNNVHNIEGSNINTLQSTSTQQLESMEGYVDTVHRADTSTSESSSGILSVTEEDAHETESSMNPTTSWTTSLTPKSHEMTDQLLRRIFKITADVKICLQRTDEVSFGSLHTKLQHSQSTHWVDEAPLNSPEEEEIDRHQGSVSEDVLVKVKEVKVLTEQKMSADPAVHTHVSPLKCSSFKLNKETGNTVEGSVKQTMCNVEIEPVLDYVEPINEDFLSANESDITNSQGIDFCLQSPTCMDPNKNTRRMGRKRKRTMCPCCISGTQAPALKSVEPEIWMTEKMSKRVKRTKSVGKDGKTSKSISCLTAKNKKKTHTPAVPASASTISVDSDELKKHKQIQRLKELLKQKEAALDLLQNSVILD